MPRELVRPAIFDHKWGIHGGMYYPAKKQSLLCMASKISHGLWEFALYQKRELRSEPASTTNASKLKSRLRSLNPTVNKKSCLTRVIQDTSTCYICYNWTSNHIIIISRLILPPKCLKDHWSIWVTSIPEARRCPAAPQGPANRPNHWRPAWDIQPDPGATGAEGCHLAKWNGRELSCQLQGKESL